MECGKCGRQNLVSEDFYWKSKTKGVRQAHCKVCQNGYTAAHYQANKQQYKDKARRNEARFKEWYVQLKSGPCTDCQGAFHWSAMQWDHRPGEIKLFCIGESLSGASCGSRSKVLEEVAKCDLVCANCHAYRTWSRHARVA